MPDDVFEADDEFRTPEEIKRLIGRHINRWRVARRLTQQELAEELDVHRTRISRWEGEGAGMRPSTARRVDEFFGERITFRGREFTVEELLLETDERRPRQPKEKAPAETSEQDWQRRLADFEKLQGELYLPTDWDVAPREIQEKRRAEREIEFDPLLAVLHAFDLPTDGLTPPLDGYEFEVLYPRWRDAAAHIAEIAQKQGSTPEQTRYWMEMCRYLACDDKWPALEGLRSLDVILVAGARGSGAEGRAVSARSLFQIAEQPPILIVSGDRPRFDRNDDVPMTEADALIGYLARGGHPGLRVEEDRIIPERRAQQHQDTAEFVKSILQEDEELSARRRAREAEFGPEARGLSMALVTGPYAMRRFLFLVEREFGDDFRHVLREIVLWPGQSDVYPTVVFDEAKDLAVRDKATGRWLIEYFKLIGGRAVGDF